MPVVPVARVGRENPAALCRDIGGMRFALPPSGLVSLLAGWVLLVHASRVALRSARAAGCGLY